VKVVLSFSNCLINELNTRKFSFAMESDQLNSSFSTLNVNAVEFVPSFGPTFASTTATSPDTISEENAKPVVVTPENNGNGEWLRKTNHLMVLKEENFCHIKCRERIISSNDLDCVF
jgi:Ataxin-2 C-terminal region